MAIERGSVKSDEAERRAKSEERSIDALDYCEVLSAETELDGGARVIMRDTRTIKLACW